MPYKPYNFIEDRKRTKTSVQNCCKLLLKSRKDYFRDYIWGCMPADPPRKLTPHTPSIISPLLQHWLDFNLLCILVFCAYMCFIASQQDQHRLHICCKCFKKPYNFAPILTLYFLEITSIFSPIFSPAATGVVNEWEGGSLTL